MKKIKILLLSLSFLLTFNIFAAELDLKFTEMKVVGSNLVFDVEIKSDVGTTYLAGLQLYINYNTAAFGTSIAAGVTVTPIGLVFEPNYSITKANNQPSRLAIGAVAIFPAFLPTSNVLTTYSKVFTISIPIIDASEDAGVNFNLATMVGQQIYYTAPTGGGQTAYTPLVAANNLTTLPLTPNTNLIFSEFGDPSDSPDNFVEIYNAGTSTVDFDNHYAYYFSIDGSSSTQLTGTFAPGDTYVIDITGTGGTSDFELSIYGDYVDGTAFDFYDGSLAGFDFTGKHAVRHYNIVTPNVTPDLAEWVISPAQDIDMTAGSHMADLNWNGATAAWRNQANWTEGFIPDAGHNVVIPNAGTTPMISNGMNAYSHNLTIGTAGLVIESDMTNGDGSLITYGTVTGNASVERYLGADRFWYISQPVTSATANVFLHTWLFTYNEGSSAWADFIEDETAPLGVMKGFAVWTSSVNKFDQDLPPLGDTTTAYVGVLNTGAISTALTFNGDGWNFVGNPYPSAVDWDAAGWTKTSLATNSYTVWDGATNGTYLYNVGGTNGTTQFIPAGQGFFVQSNAAGTLGVTNAVRAHDDMPFWKSQENLLNRLSMTISNGEVNDETVIYFNEAATTGLDYSFDARKLMAVGAPQAYTMLANDRMAINSFNSTNQTASVILGVNTPAAGEYSITASNLESFDASTPIYLEDLLTGQKVNLRETNSYAFSSGEGTSERFVVHFAEYQGIGDDPASEITSIYAVNNSVYVDFNAVKGAISIYNILGQEISRTGASNGLNVISVPQGNAVYIVKVISDNTTVTKKVFVK